MHSNLSAFGALLLPGVEIMHHQRCLFCGTEGFSSTTRSAITFRHKHRKRCPGAEFERIVA